MGESQPRHLRSFRVQPPDARKQGVLLSLSFGSTAFIDTMTVLSYTKFLWESEKKQYVTPRSKHADSELATFISVLGLIGGWTHL